MTEHKERLSPAIPPDAETWWEESAHLWRYYYAVERLKNAGNVASVIDAGCGTGYGSQILVQRLDAQVDGYDNDEPVIALAQARYRSVHFGVVDLDTEMPGGCTGEDAVVALETLEHLRDPWLFLARLPSTVRHLICSAPIVPNSNPYNPYHRHDFTLESFEAMVRGAGFEIQDRVLQSSPWRINLYAVVHAVRPIPKEAT